jgi:hypothetical protein
VIAALLLAGRLVGVVDQIDAGWALVEWAGRAYGWVPADQLPEGVGEGDRIVLRPRRDGFPFVLPREVSPALPITASLHPQRGRSRPDWRTP